MIVKTRKKLIEVALPLEAINNASIREKSIRHGHPSTLHLWWARRPLAAARAVIFAQMVDDPSEYVDDLLNDPKVRKAAEKVYKEKLHSWHERKRVFEKAQSAGVPGTSNPEPGLEPSLEEVAADIERQRLFELIEQLVVWENSTNEIVLQKAREEIKRSWRRLTRDFVKVVVLFVQKPTQSRVGDRAEQPGKNDEAERGSRQVVRHQPSKLIFAGPNPVSRSMS